VMRERQRQLAEQGDSVIEGRDIGEIVAPHAERDGIEVEELADEMRRRDERDAANTHRADDAVEVDTTHLELEQVVDRIEALVQAKVGA